MGSGTKITAVRLLGRAEVERDGVTVEIRPPKQRLILVALALAAPRLVAVDELHQLLWDDPPATAAKTVQNYVSRLRRILGEDALRHGGVGYQLDVSPEIVDIRAFESSVRTARRLLDEGGAHAAVGELELADRLWRGTIDCDSTTTSATAITARFHELRLLQRELLADAGLRAGADVVAQLEEAVHDDPSRERYWELLVLALHRDGRIADGLRAYQRARAALSEVGLEPGHALCDAERRLLADDAADPSAPATAPVALPGGLARRDPYPLVGRDQELDALERVWLDVCSGRPGALALVGAAGNGKSRLLANLAAGAHSEGAVVVLGAADDIEETPHAVVTEPVMAAVTGDHRDRLHRLARADDRTEHGDEGAWRRQLAAACSDALQAAAMNRPIVVVLEDLHWADESSLRLLQWLLRFPPGRVLFACSLRPEGLAQPALASLVADLHRHPHAAVVDVGPLGDAAIGQLVAMADASAFSADTVALLARATGGNAFLVTEVLRDGLVVDGGVVLPRAVRDVVGARLSRMGPDERRSLVAAAVAGDRVDARVVSAMTALELPGVCAALDGAVRAGVLAEAGGSLHYRFVHDLTRDAVRESVPRIERSSLHVEAARSLRNDGAPAAVIAHHLLAAGELADGADAVEWARRAGAEAAARRGFDEAAAWLARALEREEDLPVDASRRARLLCDRGMYLNAAGHTDPGRAVLAEAGTLAEDPQLLAEIAIAYSGGSGAYIDPGDDRGIAMLARADAGLGADAVAERCRIRYLQILWRIFDDDPAPRLALAEELSDLASTVDDPLLRGLALGGMQYAARGIHGAQKIVELAEEEWRVAGHLTTGMDAVVIRLRVWNSRAAVGNIDGARTAAREMRLLAERESSDTAAWYAHLLAGFHHYMDGDLDAASASADAAERTPVSLGIGTEANLSYLRTAIAQLRGDVAEERRTTEHLGSFAPQFARLFGTDIWLEAERRGDPDFARDAIDLWARTVPAIPVAWRAMAAMVMARRVWKVASRQALGVLYDALDVHRGEWIAPFPALPGGRAELTLGLLLGGMGEIDRAREDIQVAHEAHVATATWGLAALSAAALDEVEAMEGRRRRQRALRAVQ